MSTIRMSFNPRRAGLEKIEQGLLAVEMDFPGSAVRFDYEAGTAIDMAAINEYCSDLLPDDQPPQHIIVYVGGEPAK